MKNQTKEIESKENLIKEIIQKNTFFIRFAEERYELDQMRINLLQDILFGIENKKKDEIICEIYLYGSMLKKQDLIARQLFLWLLEMAENMVE